MATHFKITDNTRGRDRTFGVCAPPGSQKLYDEIQELVGDLPNPCNNIPHSLEADGWAELATIGETYEADEFTVEAITKDEFKELEDQHL